MLTDVAIMQVVGKTLDYGQNKVELKLFETQMKDAIKKVGTDLTNPHLNDVYTGMTISTQLLNDIRYKQEYLYPKMYDYFIEIVDYIKYWVDITTLTTYTYSYSAIPTNTIEYDDYIYNGILQAIMNNEGFFWEHRTKSTTLLNYIRDVGLLYDSGWTSSAKTVFIAIPDEDLTLDDIITYKAAGGMMIKVPVILTHSGTVGTNFSSMRLYLQCTLGITGDGTSGTEKHFRVAVGSQVSLLHFNATILDDNALRDGYFDLTTVTSTDAVSITVVDESSSGTAAIVKSYQVQAIGTF